MINKFKSLILGSIIILSIGACKKNNFVVDKDPLEVATTVKFATSNLLGQSYLVTSDANTEYKIPVGLTHASTTDTKVQIAYSSRRAVMGTQFNGPTEITIPAGQVIDTLRFKGIFSGLNGGRKDTVSIKITGSNVAKTGYNDSASLILQQFCAITNNVINAFDGVYDHTAEYRSTGALSYGPYSTAVKNINITSATTAEAFVENLYDYGLGDTKIILDWTDPFKPKVTVPSQSVGSGYVFKTAASGPGTFSSCEGTIDIIVDISGAETVTGYRFHLVR